MSIVSRVPPEAPASTGRPQACASRQHHPEAFNVPSNLTVGQRKQVTLLIAADHRFVVHFSEELHVIGNAVLLYELLQSVCLFAVIDDRKQHIRHRFADRRQRLDHHIVAFAFLQTPDGQHDRAILPAEFVASEFAASGRHKAGRINSRMKNSNMRFGQRPVLGQQPRRVLAVGDEVVRIRENTLHHSGQFATGSRRFNILAVHVAHVRNSAQFLHHERQPAFGQTATAMQLRHVLMQDDALHRSKESPVVAQRADTSQAPLRHRQCQAIEIHAVRRIER